MLQNLSTKAQIVTDTFALAVAVAGIVPGAAAAFVLQPPIFAVQSSPGCTIQEAGHASAQMRIARNP